MRLHNKDIHINPPQWIIIGFLFLIMIGTVLLLLPLSSAGPTSIGFTDALFTSVSAVCVTGLAVVSTGSDLSLFGQTVVMVLVQLGGLGFMVFGISVAILLGKVTGLKYRQLLQTTTNSLSARGLLRIAMIVLLFALLLEGASTLVLTWRWHEELGLADAFYYALFHSVAAFNNAGFSLFDHSMEQFVGDPTVNLSLSTLFIVGGLGLMVIADVYKTRNFRFLSLHSKVVLTTSAALLVFGFVALFLLELWNPASNGSTVSERLWAAYFQSATPRSAGFNTVDIGSMLVASQFLIIVLMFIGASSGGTGGGIKTNTFVVLLLAMFNTFRSGNQVHAFKRTIAMETIMRALAVVVSSLAFIIVATLILTVTEGINDVYFLTVLFEVVSAFSTTGLSMGFTDELSTVGKVVIMITMFVGRLGPLALAYALTYQQTVSRASYPKDQVLIG
ncbi:TrkH family potassium uptake protein [Geomicrobium sp. JSM 1781026]|uniref:TrkH family potassium uptake protein n=1 Tax=Geomicrobium sp. JSM 1781026 TaxID=3344580 RepID=UPI0035BEEC3E